MGRRLAGSRRLTVSRRLEPIADRGELAVGELEQTRGQREPPVEVARVLLGDRALVADGVLELGPGVLEDRADLYRRRARRCGDDAGRPAGVDADQQVPTGVAEVALVGGLLAEVAVVEYQQLVAEQIGDGGDVAVEVEDDAHPDRIGDVDEGIGVEQPPPDPPVAFAAKEATVLVRPVTLR